MRHPSHGSKRSNYLAATRTRCRKSMRNPCSRDFRLRRAARCSVVGLDPTCPHPRAPGLRDVCVASLSVPLALVNPCWRVIRRVRDAERRSVPISFRNARARRGTQARLRRRTNRSWLSIELSEGRVPTLASRGLLRRAQRVRHAEKRRGTDAADRPPQGDTRSTQSTGSSLERHPRAN
jgi:hypothetical protein